MWRNTLKSLKLRVENRHNFSLFILNLWEIYLVKLIPMQYKNIQHRRKGWQERIAFCEDPEQFSLLSLWIKEWGVSKAALLLLPAELNFTHNFLKISPWHSFSCSICFRNFCIISVEGIYKQTHRENGIYLFSWLKELILCNKLHH
jgi:hypothetical protein